ncbi:X-Pro dipeptidyl-peptidase (S15 family) protein [Penicillium atrosanguineum]|uniref:X-Pro dipeptidyl-peptidase (S15 family) protein n=1 Tax=Penicillium atrosanguineum TaxID=1132637 RepID=UPI0023973863|nr:X-Pro dipeptidyl-peptidase (S15 family) protein [Penicillium atrosanguineum]KAJ5297062.1 X-Pro dipeptidyl-peptidase (S15 family) protein [Penicillium atrosanguineum]
MYKTNYELYSRPSIDSRRSPPPDELLSPLAELYPHVAALQPRYNPNSCTFTGYHHTGYWAAAYTTQPLEEPPVVQRSNVPAGSLCLKTPPTP